MKKKEKKQYKKGNKKIDNVTEALDLTVKAGRKVDKKSKAFWADFKKFVDDVAIQGELLADIKEIMLRMEKNGAKN